MTRTPKYAIVEIEDLEKGDFLAFERAGAWYIHCGIYDGNGHVIHRGCEPGSGFRASFNMKSSFVSSGVECDKAGIRKDSLRKVAGSSHVYKTSEFDIFYKPRPGPEIVKWAEEKIGETGYNLFTKNCQHFCTEARYGIQFNIQVEEKRRFIRSSFGLGKGYSYMQYRATVNMCTEKILDRGIRVYKMLRKKPDVYTSFNMQDTKTSAEEKLLWKSLEDYLISFYAGNGIEFDRAFANLDNCFFELKKRNANLDEIETIRFRKQLGRVWHRVFVKLHTNDCQQWLFDRKDLAIERQADLKVMNEEDYEKCMLFFAKFIQVLGTELKVGQHVIATATVYFKRFYARNSLKCVDPWLMAPTSIFLASKVEWCGVISNSRLKTTCQTVVKDEFSHAYPQEYPFKESSVLECESYLLEMKDCFLVVYNPYIPLVLYVSDISSTDDEYNSILPLARTVVKFLLCTDVPLLYPPYLMALSALHIACGKQLKQWFASLSVDMEKILEIEQYTLHMSDILKTYDEKKEIAAILQNMPKPKTSVLPPPQNPGQEGQIQRTDATDTVTFCNKYIVQLQYL